MAAKDDLSRIERSAARMFFNVSLQSAVQLEDPNSRFGIEFQHAEARNMGNAKTMETVAHKIYETDNADGRIALETNPPNNPGLSRVIVQGGRAVTIIDAVMGGLKTEELFTIVEQKPLELTDGAPEDANRGNRMIRLVLSEKMNTEHDVAALFSWSTSSDKKIVLEMMAWPINKTAELRT